MFVGLIMMEFVGFEFILLVGGSGRFLVSLRLHLFANLLSCCLLLKGLLFFKKFIIIISEFVLFIWFHLFCLFSSYFKLVFLVIAKSMKHYDLVLCSMSDFSK